MEAPGLTASLDQPLQRDKPASVTVEAAQPDLFNSQSPELQRLVDALRAMLAFECPGLPEIQVRGVLKGLREPVYRGTAAPQGNWALQAERTVRSEVPSAPETPGRAPEAQGAEHQNRRPQRQCRSLEQKNCRSQRQNCCSEQQRRSLELQD
jgi:hypothetical protein